MLQREKSIPLLLIGVGATSYGVYKMRQYKTTKPDMSENERVVAGMSLILGIWIAYIGYAGFNKNV
jgi:hypothetical protein